MLYYFTFNDSYSGVYHSQVIDVVKLYKKEGYKIKLIAFVSPRNFNKDKNQIKEFIPDAIVLPSIPKLSNWRLNKYLLNFFTSKKATIICRGVFSTNIALLMKSKFENIIYDGRGAIKAEQEEYGVYNSTGIEHQIEDLEKEAVLKSDLQISVSSKLLEYWEEEYNYKRGNDTVIPCSVGNNHLNNFEKKYSLLDGFKEGDILLIYSGSLAGWQSLDNLDELLSEILKNEKVKILFLSQAHSTIDKLSDKFKNRIFRKWLSPSDVPKYLALGDYGILLRNDNITNKVASPVKFAEYLSAGLKVLISENIGDFSELVEENDLGFIVKGDIDFQINSIDKLEKDRIRKFAWDNFSKDMVSDKYLELIK